MYSNRWFLHNQHAGAERKEEKMHVHVIGFVIAFIGGRSGFYGTSSTKAKAARAPLHRAEETRPRGTQKTEATR